MIYPGHYHQFEVHRYKLKCMNLDDNWDECGGASTPLAVSNLTTPSVYVPLDPYMTTATAIVPWVPTSSGGMIVVAAINNPCDPKIVSVDGSGTKTLFQLPATSCYQYHKGLALVSRKAVVQMFS